jgi:hypothetical protein
VTKDEHVPEVERQSRVIKERARGIVQTLPYKTMPKRIRIALIHYVMFWLNNIPKEDQVSSPKDLILGEKVLDFNALCKLPFGAYVQVHDDAQTTNTMEPRTTGGICLGPSNMQSGYRFFNLITGDVIIRQKWTELPVPSEVILRLEELSNDPNDSIQEMLMEDENENEVESSMEQDDTNSIKVPNAIEAAVVEDEEDRNMEQIPILEESEEEMPLQNPILDISMSDEMTVTSNSTGQTRYDLRPNRNQDYSHRYTCLLSVKAGLRKWGDKARAAVREELMGFIKEQEFENIKKPTLEQIRKALHIHCFVIEKRNGRIKARAVADGSTQDRYSEEETYSPTV